MTGFDVVDELKALIIEKTEQGQMLWQWVSDQQYDSGNFSLILVPTTNRHNPYAWVLTYRSLDMPGIYNELVSLLKGKLQPIMVAEAISEVKAL